MAERYKLPDALGGGEYEALTDFKSKVGDDWRFRFKIPGVGCVDIPAEALTPVKPPTPPEPEPGAYLIDGRLCVRVGLSWAVDIEDINPKWWMAWRGVWDLLGGPDVTITRLVPERAETVTLPWEGHSQTGHFILGVTPCRPNGREAANISIDDALATVTPPVAREMAAALLAFANGAGAES